MKIGFGKRVRLVKVDRRIAAEGVIMARSDADKAVILEINSETDFVSRDEGFLAFANAVADAALANATADVAALNAVEIDGKSVEDTRLALVSKIGENIQVRRVEAVDGLFQPLLEAALPPIAQPRRPFRHLHRALGVDGDHLLAEAVELVHQ